MKRLFALLLVSIIAAACAVPSGAASAAATDAPGAPTSAAAPPAAGAPADAPAYSFKFSGYFKGDAIYDQAMTYPGNYALWIPYGGNEKDDAMYITARETRIGLNFSWEDGGYKTTAKLEYDFYGLGAAPSGLNAMENKATTMMRHAYLELTKGRWSVLAGQTSDVISPLVPRTVNYTVCWDQGNIGYRRPQLRVSTWAGLGEKAKLKLAVAATRTLGSDLDGDKVDDGSDAAVPTVQGRLGIDMKFGESGLAAVGVSGHYGIEKWGVDDSTETESWSFNTDVKLVVNERISLSGEFFVGQDLGAYLGGIGQSVNPLDKEIFAMGGWGMLSVKPHDRVTVNAGYSFDDPDDGDFELAEDEMETFKDKNSVAFGNLIFDVTGNVSAMLELSYLKTEYLTKLYETVLKEESFDGLRVQFALIAAIQ